MVYTKNIGTLLKVGRRNFNLIKSGVESYTCRTRLVLVRGGVRLPSIKLV